MPVQAILGGQWGDEGKGKIVDVLCQSADVVARFQGGANAGHTIQIGEKETILHQLPSGILHEKVHCILGNGMVLDPVGLLAEMNELLREGVDLDGRIHISELAHVVTPLHKILDAAFEIRLGSMAIGTTKRGIGPCYSDKINRTGIQIRDLRFPSLLKEKVAAKLQSAIADNLLSPGEKEKLSADLEEFYAAAAQMVPFIDNTVTLIDRYFKEGKKILIEGAQGTLLDLDFGSYPFVTSSNTSSGNICTGAALSPNKIGHILGVFKAYCTRVGSGPFPTELHGIEGDYLQQKGDEFGATTRRKRRCGWFDGALAKFSVMLNGFDSVAITKLDVLDDLAEIKVCTHYKNGEYPSIHLEDARPQYVSLPGWQTDISDVKKFSDLPARAKDYLNFLSDLFKAPISHISVGKKRSQIIEL